MSEIKPIFNALLRSKVGAVLLVIQIAITLAIVSNAAFMIYDRLTYLNQETGYDESSIFKFNVFTFDERIDVSAQYEIDEDAIRAIPGVISASMMNQIPLSGSGDATTFRLRPASEESELAVGMARAAYFMGDDSVINTLGINLIEGRNFHSSEVIVSDNFSKLPAVAIISKHFAEEISPDASPLGTTIYFGDYPLEIIGITDAITGPWLSDSRPNNVVMLPFAQARGFRRFLVRTEPDMRDEVMKQMEDVMLSLESKRVISQIKGLDELKQDYLAQDTLMARMLVSLIVILILVTALGIFGLTLFNISKRTKQIGTRRALGAKKSDIVNYFLVENSLVSLIGLVVGTVLAIMLGDELMKLYSLPALNIWYVAATAVGIFLMSLLAVLAPAKRAANISPSIATRSV